MSISQKLFDLIPNHVIQNPKPFNIAGDIMSRPVYNRLIMGGTAILSQPFIDEHNKRVDRDTARASRNRTIGKILAGTAVGCAVRGGVSYLVKKYTHENTNTVTWNNILTPRNISKTWDKNSKNIMINYRTSLAMILSLGAMLITNVAFDMPLTTVISNFLNKIDKKRKEANNVQNEPQNINNNRTTKIAISNVFKPFKGGSQ